MDNNSIYTADELEILELTKRKRIDIVNDMTKGGIPGYKEVEILNQVLAGLDKSVNDAATMRQKHQDSNARADAIAKVIETIKQIRQQEAEAVGKAIDAELYAEYIPTDIVEGEQDMSHKQFTLDEMMIEEDN